jgi:SAM-dependent methyltransferase
MAQPLYEDDLAHIHATGFGALADEVSPFLLELLGDAPKKVVDVGCGSGVTTSALARAGHDVVGIEPSASFVQMARAAAPSATILHASAYEVALPRCYAVFAIGEPLTYHPPEVDAKARLTAFVASVSRALEPGGVFVFDLIDATGPSLDAVGWRSTDAWAILHRNTEDHASQRLVREIETFRRDGALFRRHRETHHAALFDPDEVRALLEHAELRVETSTSHGHAKLLPRRTAYCAFRRP